MGIFEKQPVNPSTGRQYKYSFSGADAKVLVWFQQTPHLIRPLESVHTLSVSVHEAKGQARALGHRGIRGLSRGVRTIAGSLIMTVINDHPLRALHDQYNEAFIAGGYREPTPGWSLDRHRIGVGTLFNNYSYNNRLSTLLPPFNVALQFVSEGGPPFRDYNSDPALSSIAEHAEGAGAMIVGMEFLDEGHVTSVQDIVTEITFSFIAHDYKPLSYFSADADATVPPPTPVVDLTEHDALMRDLFYDNVGAVSKESPLTTLEEGLARAVGLEPTIVNFFGTDEL
jgi:hypothetical protein